MATLFYRLALGVLLLLGLLPLRALALGPIILPDGSFAQSITRYTWFYEDSSGLQTIEQILTPATQLRFTPSHAQSLKRGAIEGNIWLRTSLHNSFSERWEAVLTLSNKRLDVIEVYDISDPAEPKRVIGPPLNGALDQAHAYHLYIAPKTTQTYLIRIQTDALLNTDIALKSLDQFNSREQIHDLITGAITGLVLLAFLYFAYAALSTRQTIAWAGVLGSLAIVIYVPANVGLDSAVGITQHIPKGSIETVTASAVLIAQLLAVAALHWRQRWIPRLMMALMAVQALIVITDPLSPSYVTELVLYASIAVNQLVLLILLRVRRSRNPGAQAPLWVGALALGVGILATLLNEVNLLSLQVTEELLVFILPAVLVLSLFFAQLMTDIRKAGVSKSLSAQIPPDTMGQISHELRTPINGVIGMCELMSDTPLSASQRDYLETISMAGEDMLVLVNELSDLGKLRKRDVVLEKKPVGITHLLNRALQHFQHEASRKQVELVLDITDDFPERLIGDRNRVMTVLYNVMTRIIAYIEHGGMTVTTSYYKGEQAQGLRIQMLISATVIKHEALDSLLRLMQPGNTRVDDNDPRTWDMYVVRGLIRQMRGALDIESLTSQGGSVTLFLPMDREDPGPNAGKADTSFTGLRVLVVDDNASLRSVIEKQLRRWGATAESTYSGKEALAILRTVQRAGNPYDMIFIDHDMPIMSGLQLAERIRLDEEIRQKPASLMLTGLSTNSVERTASASGIDYIIAKPASGSRLREALAILQKQRVAR
ncbi:MAG: response regulator [Pseudomonadota bacterium]|nr:response regulator [Pseudomonadota bacterium]